MAAATNWLFNFLIAEITPIGIDNIGWRYYLVYLCICISATVTFFFFFPETRGRSLEEIDEIFLQSKSVFDPVRVAKELPSHISEAATIADDEKATEGRMEVAKDDENVDRLC